MKKEHDIRIDRSKLHPWLDQKLTVLLRKCAKKGIYLIITEGFRSKEYQDSLYAQGRTKPGKIVTNAKGSTWSSQHMWGIAFDIAINDSKLLYDAATIRKVAVIAKGIGLGWGGDWKSIVDTPHFYLPEWGSTTTRLKALYGTPDKFRKTWKKMVKREKGALLWKTSSKKTGSHCRIPKGAVVEVLYTKDWYTKVRYKNKVGYVNKKFVV
ncbi:M15 family metallopeptidase [Jutongia sp.]